MNVIVASWNRVVYDMVFSRRHWACKGILEKLLPLFVKKKYRTVTNLNSRTMN